MPRDYLDYIEDIIFAIEDIEIFTEGYDFDRFADDKRTLYAVVRCFEIIGEATKNIPDSVKTEYPGIPWRKVAGMRDTMIHEYFGVDIEIIWKTVNNDIPVLKNSMMKICRDLGIE
jgi:uncharacterized protein with HEPN domain